MVDSVSNWASRSLLHSQNNATNAAANAFAQTAKVNAKPAQQMVIDQMQQPTDQNRNLVKQAPASNTLATTTIAAGKTLPRGSLVDMVV